MGTLSGDFPRKHPRIWTLIVRGDDVKSVEFKATGGYNLASPDPDFVIKSDAPNVIHFRPDRAWCMGTGVCKVNLARVIQEQRQSRLGFVGIAIRVPLDTHANLPRIVEAPFTESYATATIELNSELSDHALAAVFGDVWDPRQVCEPSEPLPVQKHKRRKTPRRK